MSRLFGRLATIVVSREAPLLPVRISSPLRIQFKIQKQPYTPPNTADISVYNLSAATRKQLQTLGAEVELRAGYAADAVQDITHLPVLFRGDARTVDHVRRGSEWVTHIQCGDGEIAYRYALATVTKGPGADTVGIMRDLAKQLVPSGIDITAFLSQLTGIGGAIKKKAFVTGFAAQGNPLQELDKILAPEGYIISVQNGALQVLSSSGVNTKQVIRIADDSGMIGSPEHGSPDKNGLPSVLKVASLLRPQIAPGDQVFVDAAATKGFFRAEKVDHTGDTHSSNDEWRTDIEARTLNQSQAAL